MNSGQCPVPDARPKIGTRSGGGEGWGKLKNNKVLSRQDLNLLPGNQG